MIQIYIIFFQTVLTMFLVFASMQDVKTREVSLKTQLAIALVSLPLVIFNFENISIFHSIYIIIMFILHILGLGGADFKILVPLSLTLQLIPLVIFTIAFNFFGLIQGLVFKTRTIPLVPAITLSYFIIILV